jgi:hypothetical protein
MQVVSPTDFTAAVGLSAQTSLDEVLRSIHVQGINVGEQVAAVFSGFLSVDLRGDAMATIRPQAWGAMVYGQFRITLGEASPMA